VQFWYRQSPHPLERTSMLAGNAAGVTSDEPPMQFAGDILINLDMDGRLVSLEAIPPPIKTPASTPEAAVWARLFADAGLDQSAWTPVSPTRNPLYFADGQAAWQGAYRQLPDVRVRIEAASYAGRPVSFAAIGPWSQPDRIAPIAPLRSEKIRVAVLVALMVTTLVAACVFARRNLRLGRGDRRGAGRLAAFLASVTVVSWVLNEHHVATIWEMALAQMTVSGALLVSAWIWVLYIALEPFVRRRLPHLLVSWTRLLAGAWRDPLVGRDVLIGCVAGASVSCLERLRVLAPALLGYPEEFPFERSIVWAFANGASVSRLIDGLSFAMLDTLLVVVLLVFLRAVMRSEWLAAAVVLIAGAALLAGAAESPWIELPVAIVTSSFILFVLLRFGAVAVVVALFVNYVFMNYPMTFRSSAWYAGIGFTALFVLAALAIYGFRVSLGDRRLLDTAVVED
jgi:serine/threonine-protein kinase